MVFLKNKIGKISILNREEWNDEDPKTIAIKMEGELQTKMNMSGQEGCAISCGVAQVYDLPINKFMDKVVAIIAAEAITEDGTKKMLAAMFKKIFRPITARYILLSDNDSKIRSTIHGILSDICETETGWATNPNSGAKIKVWTYKK